MKRRHVWDEVADDLLSWLDAESNTLADMIVGGDEAPFAAPKLSDTQKLKYYQEQFFLPDGNPNQVGRSHLLERVGMAGYAQIWQALQKGLPQEDSDGDV